jgi:hypothetical protein
VPPVNRKITNCREKKLFITLSARSFAEIVWPENAAAFSLIREDVRYSQRIGHG